MSTYRALFAVREFRVLFGGQANVAGQTMQMLALSALVYARTASPLLASVAYLAGFAPRVLGAVTLLSLADRVPARAFLVTWDVMRAVVAVVLAFGGPSVAMMLALVMTAGVIDAVGVAVRTALLVEVLPTGMYVLGQSALNIAVGALQITGFAVGGTLLAALGPRPVLIGSAGVALACATIDRWGLRRRAPRVGERGSLAATWRGNRVLLGDRAIRALLLAQWLPCGLIVGAEALYVPYAGADAGVLFTAAAVGMLTGDFVIGRWVSATLRGRLILPLYVLLATPYLAFLAHPATSTAAGLVTIASFGYAANLGLQESYVTALPGTLRGQGLGLAGSGMMTTQALAASAVGAAAEALGPAMAIAVAATASLLVTAALVPALRLRPRPTTLTITHCGERA
jgi:MFS family permease